MDPGPERMNGMNLVEHESAEELRRQIAVLRSQLEQSQRMATIGELASTTTHEFNNLLTTIINYARMGLRHKDEATRDKALQKINDAATRATKVASSVLAMARNRTGAFEPVNLALVLDDTLALIGREFQKHRILLETEVAAQLPSVMGSSTQLQRVLVNLLVNARQATRPGGSVRVRLECDAQTNEVVLQIRDTGSGIAPELLPKIFDPFFTTKDGPDASGQGGTGIGLSSCKQIIDAHSGRIRVDSGLGKGTAFTIRLPAHSQTQAA
jgi:two-component system, NtrC family, sensor kinase